MAAMQDIRRRKNSIQSTQQITKAMKLVAAVKLRRMEEAAAAAKDYTDCLHETVQDILEHMGQLPKYPESQEACRKAVIVITSNRGLAGGYHINILKLITEHPDWRREELALYTVGAKGRDMLKRRGYDVQEDFSDRGEHLTYEDVLEAVQGILRQLREGSLREIYLAYGAFQNTVSYVPVLRRIWPVEEQRKKQEKDSGKRAGMEFEPDEEALLGEILPRYAAGLVYGAIAESRAAENAARMQAMDNATGNAEELLKELTLMYNRARQHTVTQELTEIIAGAEALI